MVELVLLERPAAPTTPAHVQVDHFVGLAPALAADARATAQMLGLLLLCGVGSWLLLGAWVVLLLRFA